MPKNHEEYRVTYMIQGDYYEPMARKRSKFKAGASHRTDVPISKKRECTDNPARDDSALARR